MTSDPLQVSIGYVETPKVRLVAPTGGLIDHQKFGSELGLLFVADTTPEMPEYGKLSFIKTLTKECREIGEAMPKAI